MYLIKFFKISIFESFFILFALYEIKLIFPITYPNAGITLSKDGDNSLLVCVPQINGIFKTGHKLSFGNISIKSCLVMLNGTPYCLALIFAWLYVLVILNINGFFKS